MKHKTFGLAALVLAASLGSTGVAVAQSAMIPKPKYINVELDAHVYLSWPSWTVHGVTYVEGVYFGSDSPITKYELAHTVDLFGAGKIFVPLKPFISHFWKPWHPVYYPNINPAPVGVSRAKWAAAIAEAKQFEIEANTPGSGISVQEANTHLSLLANARQWFPDPSDPFFDRRFPLKDLKNGFVLSRKPYVVVSATSGVVWIEQYIGYSTGNQAGVWIGESVNPKTGVVTAIAPNAGANPLNPGPGYPGWIFGKIPSGQGVTLKTIQRMDPTWAAGAGLDVVPLTSWNPKDVTTIPTS